MPYKFDNIIEILKQVFLNIAEKRQLSFLQKFHLQPNPSIFIIILVNS